MRSTKVDSMVRILSLTYYFNIDLTEYEISDLATLKMINFFIQLFFFFFTKKKAAFNI